MLMILVALIFIFVPLAFLLMSEETYRGFCARTRPIMVVLAVCIAGAMLAWISPPTHAVGNAVYIASTSRGANNGSNCSNAFVYTYFNDPTNYNASPSGVQIGPGTTVHLCDVVTGPTNCANMLDFRNDVTGGSAGLPMTLYMELNAGVQCPSTDGRQIIEAHVDGGPYLVIDGGVNGFIRETLNGTPGGPCFDGPCSQQHIGKLFNLSPCDNCEYKNLHLTGAYVHVKCEASSGCDTGIDDTQVGVSQLAGTGTKFHDNVVVDAGWAINIFPNNATEGSNIQVYNTDFSNINHAIALAGSCDANGIYMYGNHLHAMDNWDTGSADEYHHDGIHGFCGSLTGTTTNVYIYNNKMDGNQGECCVTAWIFMEGGATSGRTPWSATGTEYIFNNVIIGSLDLGNGQISARAGAHHFIYGNTIVGGGPVTGACIAGGDGFTPDYTIKDNVFSSCDQVYSMDSAASIAAIDYNVYGNAGGANPIWRFDNYVDTSNFATWQAGCSCDANSQSAVGAPLANFNASTGVPSPGFIGAGVGVNLTSIATGALAPLAFDTTAGNSRVAVARPSTGPWDIGAFQITTAPPINPPPNGGGLFANNITIPPATVGVPFGPITFTSQGGSPPVQWSMSPSPLAGALTASVGGVLGPFTPTQSGLFPFTITVTDSNSQTSALAKTLSVAPAPVTPPPPPPPPPPPADPWTVSQSTMNWAGVVGGPNTSQVETITNVSSSAISVTWADSVSWLCCSVDNITIAPGASGTITHQARLGGLAAGSYTGKATITGAGLTKTITVNLVVSPVAPPPPPPAKFNFSISPSSLSFSGVAAGANPATQTIKVADSSPSGSGSAFTVTSSQSWLTVTPTKGNTGISVTATAKLSGLAAGLYNANLVFTSSALGNSPITVPVNFSVTAAVLPAQVCKFNSAGTLLTCTLDTTNIGHGQSITAGASSGGQNSFTTVTKP